MLYFDETPVPGSSPQDIDMELAYRFLQSDRDITPTTLHKLNVTTEDEDGELRITVGGALLCTRHPRQWLPNAYIQAVHYAGERHDINYQIDARDCGGTLDRQIFDALQFIRRNMRIRAIKKTGRVDRPQFSERAIFEALTNAVAHRDYSMSGARIRLHLFPDRLELYVPGSLANTLTIDSMYLRQFSRNQLIVSLLGRSQMPQEEELGRSYIMDRRGDGLPIIREECLALSGRLPDYMLIDKSELRLIMWAAN